MDEEPVEDEDSIKAIDVFISEKKDDASYDEED